ncbi:CBO0543 family protein [Paenibacillus silvisoli]|uniref:CBO0543 family protein n=1 Tax=Paenibacillus silvisoli TaxID=3110539 RepID=UPI002804E461|nr:CBO0543 family protein [Paenibacillus silvisoli]
MEHYRIYSLNSWQFWTVLPLSIAFIVIVWRLIDRRRLQELLFFALVWEAVAQVLDDIGTNFLLWTYPIKVTPLYTIFINNVFYIPLTFMLVYQYFRSWRSYAIASLIYSAIVAFVVEPIHIWADLYLMLNWKLIYSFPIYFALALLIRWFVEKVRGFQVHANKNDP